MLSSLVPLLVVVAILCWVVLPAFILMAAAVGSRNDPAAPVWVRPCRASDPDKPCWATGEALYCTRHEGARLEAGDAGREVSIA
ncbi:MAG: hypothetical protein ACRD0O_21490 [Acidimicrobiia bacterium]